MMSFSFGGHEYKIRNPTLNNVLEINRKTLFGRTASGVLYRYDKGVSFKRVEVRWEELTEKEKDSLLDAFQAIRTSQFNLKDHEGNEYLAIFLVDKISFETISDETSADDNFVIDEFLIPSSERKNARYNCSIELEIS